MAEFTKVQLNPCDASLNIDIEENGSVCSPFSEDGCGYMFGGVRGTVGVIKGRWCFSVKALSVCPIDVRETDHLRTSAIIRVGVSQLHTPVGRLGETHEGVSVGYNSTGKKVNGSVFEPYAASWGRMDVRNELVTVLVDLESEPGVALVSFARNLAWQGPAFRVAAPRGPQDALFPHILVRNCRVRFDCSWAPPAALSRDMALGEEGGALRAWGAVTSVAGACAHAPSFPPPPLSQCEVMVMVGLPGSGKTSWALNQARVARPKRYLVLSPDCVLDAMRVLGVALQRQAGAAGPGLGWGEAGAREEEGGAAGGALKRNGDETPSDLERYYALAAHTFSALVARAAKVPRNYILDQTHVSVARRGARLAPFKAAGFALTAALAAPSTLWLHSMQEQGSVGPQGSPVTSLVMRRVPDEVLAPLMAEFEVPRPGGPEGFASVELVHAPPDPTLFGGEQEQGGEDPLDRQLDRIEAQVVGPQREQGRQWLAKHGLPGPAPSQPTPMEVDGVIDGAHLQSASSACTPAAADVSRQGGTLPGAQQQQQSVGGAGQVGDTVAGGVGDMSGWSKESVLHLLHNLPPEVMDRLLISIQGQGQQQQQKQQQQAQ